MLTQPRTALYLQNGDAVTYGFRRLFRIRFNLIKSLKLRGVIVTRLYYNGVLLNDRATPANLKLSDGAQITCDGAQITSERICKTGNGSDDACAQDRPGTANYSDDVDGEPQWEWDACSDCNGDDSCVNETASNANTREVEEVSGVRTVATRRTDAFRRSTRRRSGPYTNV